MSLYVHHPDYAAAILTDLPVSGSDPLSIRLDQGCTLEGTAPPGLPVTLAYAENTYDQSAVHEDRPSFELIFLTHVDSQGWYQFLKVPPARYYLTLNNPDHYPRLEIDYHREGRSGYPQQPIHLIELKRGALERIHLGWER